MYADRFSNFLSIIEDRVTEIRPADVKNNIRMTYSAPTGIGQTALVERANLTWRELIAPLSRRTWSVRDLLQLPVPEGIWLDSSPATKGCQ